MKAIFFLFLASLTLLGCGLARQQELEAKRAALQEQNAAAVQICDSKFPKGETKTAIVRAQCMNEAAEILRPTMPFPDLLDVFMTSRMAIAERVQKGQMTIAQANEEITARRSQLVAEEQRRMLANRSVAAQETSAQASVLAAGPRSCTKFGNTINCY